MQTQMSPEGVDKLVDVFIVAMDKGIEVPAFVRERMSLVREDLPTLFGISPSNPHDPDAADQVASIVPMHANAVGGFIVVGVDPTTMEVNGTGVETEWLKSRLSRSVDAAIDIDAWAICGIRMLIVRVGSAGVPVADKDGHLLLPSGEVNRSQWWEKYGTDVPASVVASGTVELFRKLASSCAGMDDQDVLAHIGTVTPKGMLTKASVCLLASTADPRFSVNDHRIGGRSMPEQFL